MRVLLPLLPLFLTARIEFTQRLNLTTPDNISRREGGECLNF
jgi:hypothetical protein